MSKEQLTKIREYIIDNVMMSKTFMYSDEVRGENESDTDLLEVIASLYEVLHREVTGEPYNYMFHYANKIYGWVEDGLFTEVENEKNNNTSSDK